MLGKLKSLVLLTNAYQTLVDKFWPPLMNDQLDTGETFLKVLYTCISEIFLKVPENLTQDENVQIVTQ